MNRGDHTSIATFENGPMTHDYAGNLADVCPVGALLSHDFRFKMRVWFLKTHDSVCPGCSTGCNIHVDERDGEVQRLRPRRNVDVNKSWMCDLGRAGYKEIARATRVTGLASGAPSSWEGTSVAAALDAVAAKLKDAGEASAFLATPAGHQRGPLRLRRGGRGDQGPARLPGGRPRPEGPRAAPTRSCCARTATPTPRAASTRAWGAPEWRRS